VLPSDYFSVVSRGIRALLAVEGQLRAKAESDSDSSALWLQLRDVKSLTGWLESADDWEWQTGLARTFSSPRDFGVLEEAFVEARSSPYEETTAIRALITFLTRYERGDFPFESSSTYPQTPNNPKR
jgi:hypothetical protein